MSCVYKFVRHNCLVRVWWECPICSEEALWFFDGRESTHDVMAMWSTWAASTWECVQAWSGHRCTTGAPLRRHTWPLTSWVQGAETYWGQKPMYAKRFGVLAVSAAESHTAGPEVIPGLEIPIWDQLTEIGQICVREIICLILTWYRSKMYFKDARKQLTRDVNSAWFPSEK